MASPTAKRKRVMQKISAELPAHHSAKIVEAAAWRGVPVASFVIEAAIKEAEQVILKERLIELTREDAELVASLLDNPPEPNAAMRKAVRAHQRMIRA